MDFAEQFLDHRFQFDSGRSIRPKRQILHLEDALSRNRSPTKPMIFRGILIGTATFFTKRTITPAGA
ncbi:hypothetical protein DID97_34680 [Burkholderia sp. Bp8977]|nr:hypothetical protein DIE10_36210 [Burkholderia sp. Bp9011]RQR83600.1 hypothetical protein DIE09_36225 [Burkholderia sp. Bp9010]RQS64145.1 hypothetical protein DID97_34680 [Burkholderia sp. Bp8977]